MNTTIAIMKRELKSYFGSPVAYVFLVVFLVAAAYWAFNSRIYEARDANLILFFGNLPLLFVLFAPAIAMRMWPEERNSGTIELLFTLPVTVRQAVVGKFLAGWIFFGIALLLTIGMVAMVAYLGDPDFGPIFTGYFGAFLMAGSYLAIGAFFSALTKNQVIALILGVVGCFIFWIVGNPFLIGPIRSTFGALPAKFLESMSFLTHYDVMQRGLLEFHSLFFMVAVAIGFLASCVIILDNRKAA